MLKGRTDNGSNGRTVAVRRTKPRTEAGNAWIDAFTIYLQAECHLSSNTSAAYRRDLTRFFRWLDGRDLRKLRVQQLSEYAAWLTTEGLAAASRARHLVSLKLFYRYLQLEGRVRDNPVELLGTPKLWQHVPQVMSEETVARLVECPHPSDPHWRRDRAMLELLYAAGCRASELAGMRTEDIRLDARHCLCRGNVSGQG
jgi:integrase/recombinase XerD